MTVKITSFGLRIIWQEQDGSWIVEDIILISKDLHPFMWQTNTAEESGA